MNTDGASLPSDSFTPPNATSPPIDFSRRRRFCRLLFFGAETLAVGLTILFFAGLSVDSVLGALTTLPFLILPVVSLAMIVGRSDWLWGLLGFATCLVSLFVILGAAFARGC